MHSFETHLFIIIIFKEWVQQCEPFLLIRVRMPNLLQVCEYCTKGEKMFFMPLIFMHFILVTASCNAQSFIGDMVPYHYCSASHIAYPDSISSNNWTMSSVMHNNKIYRALQSFLTSSEYRWTSKNTRSRLRLNLSGVINSMWSLFERRYFILRCYES